MENQKDIDEAFYEGACLVLNRFCYTADDPLSGLDRDEIADYVNANEGLYPNLEKWLQNNAA